MASLITFLFFCSVCFFTNGFPKDSGLIHFPESEEFSTNLRKSEQKCEEYTTANINKKCDYVNARERIVPGGQFPFVALAAYSVENKLEFMCGAALISDQHVLIPAHCAITRIGKIQLLRVGDLGTNNTDSYTDFGVEKIFVHPEYKLPLRYNDIAIIKLDRLVKFSKFIQPVCLYTKPVTVQKATSLFLSNYRDNNETLMRVELPIFEKKRCEDSYKNEKRTLPNGISSDILCTGGSDRCEGESAGPIILTDDKNSCKFYLIGISIFGKGCGNINTPAAAVKISEYVKWIEDTIW